MEQKVGNLTRSISFTTAYDKRSTDRMKDYGIHCVEMRFLVKGKRGAVQFVLFTGWYLPHNNEELMKSKGHLGVLPADLGYHSPKPMYEDQPSRKDCPYLNGKTCYYDGSGLNAEEPYEILARDGEDALWKFLEQYYHDTLERE